MSRAICAAKTCYNSYTNAPMIKFFPFPDEKTRSLEWIKNSDRDDLIDVPLSNLTKKYYLCSAHFEDKWFINPRFKTKFKPNVKPVPTIFVNNLSEFVPKSIQTKIQYKLLTNIKIEHQQSTDADLNELPSNSVPSNKALLLCMLCAKCTTNKMSKDIRKNENSQLKEMIQRILHKQVLLDDVPLHVCIPCEWKVIECYKDILLFEKKYNQFKEVIMKQQFGEILEEHKKHSKIDVRNDDIVPFDNEVFCEPIQRDVPGCISDTFINKCDIYDNTLPDCDNSKIVVNNRKIVVNNRLEESIVLLHQCEYCGAQFNSVKHLNKHLRTHAIDLFCLFCGKEFSTVAQKRFHDKSHTQLKTDAQIHPVLCEICGRLIPDQQKLEKHIKKCHNYRVTCKICSKSFSTKDSLKRHSANHVSIAPCKDCSRELPVKSHVKRHTIIGLLKCFCSNTMKYTVVGVRSLYLHVKYSHQGQLDENATVKACPYCKETVVVKRKLRVPRQSTENKPFHCDYCNKWLSNQVSYNKHLKTHSPERPFACTFCTKKFRTRSCLKQHELIHKSVYNYKCEECDRLFKRQQSLIIHKRTHLEERPFACATCNKGFLQRSDLRRHFRVHNRKRTLMDLVESMEPKTHQFDINTSTLPQLTELDEEVGLTQIPANPIDLFDNEKKLETDDNFLELLQSMPIVWKFNS